jgi:hypothetical protein
MNFFIFNITIIVFVTNATDFSLHVQKPDVCDSHVGKCTMKMHTEYGTAITMLTFVEASV